MNTAVFARRILSTFLVAALLFAVHASTSFAAEEKTDDLIKKAQAAVQKGDLNGALELMNKAVKADPKNAQAWFALGRVHAALRQHDKAAAAYGKALEASPQASPLYMHRAMELFKAGQIKECVEDFDNYNKLLPDGAAQNWQRGIALYYAGRFADGKKQFELHQTVNKQDVENAVWHFLCTARAEGVDKARAQLIPISGDTRIPMAKVHELFAGKAKPDDVLAAARAGEPPPDRLARQLFYAHLYLGIYFEATGDAKQARDHIFKAAEKADQNDYMGDVARVHADILRKQEKK
ncbi:MAG: tetratricopeptide repeat protein [Verrucomicrobia bacterium]|nr:tetratricopeptide repeat protein [Verrucomicrobiota bacterium]